MWSTCSLTDQRWQGRFRTQAITLMFLVTIASGPVAGTALAHDDHDHRPAADTPGGTAIPNTGPGAIYLEVENRGSDPDRLTRATTDAALAVELHGAEVTGGVMRMSPIPDGIDVPPGASATLEPQGMHLMLVNLSRDLRLGETFEVILECEQAGNVTINVSVATEQPSEGTSVDLTDLTIGPAWSLPAPRLGDATPEAVAHH